jgi:hypothetical protein
MLTINVMRAIRLPTDWTYTQFLFNYSVGFCKRGLIGELIRQLNLSLLYTYDFFVTISTTLFLLNLFLIGRIGLQLIKQEEKPLIFCAILYASSLAVCMLANTIGYAEQIGLFITLIAVQIKNFRTKFLFITIGCSFLVFVHEATIIIFFPILFISLLLDKNLEGRRYALVFLLMYSIVLLLLTFFVSNSTLNSNELNNLSHFLSMKMTSNISPQPQALEILNHSISDNLTTMETIWHFERWQFALIASFLVTIPTALLLLYVCNNLLISNGIKRGLRILSLMAVFSPLILHFLAWDFNRWNTVLITNSFILLYISQKRQNQVLANTLNWLEPIFIFLIFLNGASELLLLGGSPIRQFPFWL